MGSNGDGWSAVVLRSVRARRRDPRRRPLPPRERRPRRLPRRLFAYTHADWYVAEVLAKAAAYRGAAVAGSLPQLTATAGQVLRDPRIALTPIQRADLRGGLIDPRLVSALAAIA